MAIVVNLDVMLAKRKMRSKELAEIIGITTANLSILKKQTFFLIDQRYQRMVCPNLTCTQEKINKKIIEQNLQKM